jgi:hypothetical protein
MDPPAPPKTEIENAIKRPFLCAQYFLAEPLKKLDAPATAAPTIHRSVVTSCFEMKSGRRIKVWPASQS